MANDDRKVLFLSFAGALKILVENRVTKLLLPNRGILYKELKDGIYYLDYGYDLIINPAESNYEGYFNAWAHSVLIVYLKNFHESLPGLKSQYIALAKTDEEKSLAREYTGNALYREPGTDRQLRHLNALLRSNGVAPIDLDEASTFQQGISVLRRRCVFKEIVE